MFFPWQDEISAGSRTKPYIVLAQKIRETRAIEELSEEEIATLFRLATETEYVDIRISNFAINEKGIWIVDTERHTHEDFKSSFASVADAQVYYMRNFVRAIRELRSAPERHPLDTQSFRDVPKKIQSPDRNDTHSLECYA